MKTPLTTLFVISMFLFFSCFTGKKADRITLDRLNTTKEVVLQAEESETIANADTSFFLIAHDIQTAEIYGSFFTGESSVSFKRNENLVFEEGLTYFTTFFFESLVSWDTLSIRKRELEQGAALGGSRVNVERRIRDGNEF